MALVNQCIPLFEPADEFTVILDATILGKTFVSFKANTALDATSGLQRVVQTAAAAYPVGVLHGDGVQNNTRKIVCGNKIVPITADGAIQSGQSVEVGTAGKVRTLASGVRVGTAMTNAADGTECFVKLNI